MNRPAWATDANDSSWQNVKDAFSKDWEQTKHDFGSKTARDLGQDAGDTVKEATTGATDGFDKHEDAFRFGYAAQKNYKAKHPAWDTELDTQLRKDYGTDYDRDRGYIQHAYERKY